MGLELWAGYSSEGGVEWVSRKWAGRQEAALSAEAEGRPAEAKLAPGLARTLLGLFARVRAGAGAK